MRVLSLTLVLFILMAVGAGWVRAAEYQVNSTADSGPGTLRQCMSDVDHGDSVTFSAMIFSPASPGTIRVLSALPHLGKTGVTIDATSAGVVLDGRSVSPSAAGLVVWSDSNSIRGLQILWFPAGGIVIEADADHNTVDGNLISGNGGTAGIEVLGEDNTILDNLIGTDITGTMPMTNSGDGISVFSAANNTIGPGNTIAYNGGHGIAVEGAGATANTITQNSITQNTLSGIDLSSGGNGELAAPVITECTETSITGSAPPSCTIEVFSDAADEGGTYEGTTTSDGAGDFVFNRPGGWTAEFVTAAATDSAGNTSELSEAASVSTEPTTWGAIKADFR